MKQPNQTFLPPLWIMTTAAVLLLLWLLVQLKELVTLVVVGYAIAYLINPLLNRMERHKISRPVGIVVVFLAGSLVLAVLATTALPTILHESGDLIEQFPAYFATARDRLLERYELLLRALPPEIAGRVRISPDKLFPTIGPDVLSSVLSGVTGALLGGYSVTLTVMNLALLPFIVYYLAVDFSVIHSTLLAFCPRRYRDTVVMLGKRIDTFVSSFVRGQIVVGFILFLLYGAGLGLLGVELWFIIALISGFGNFVPYLGTLVGIVFASIMTLVTYGDLTHLVAAWGVFAGVQFLEGTYITPKVVGESVGLSPLMVIISIFAAGKLFGLVGLFLAIPIAAVVRVVAGHMYSWFLSRIEANGV